MMHTVSTQKPATAKRSNERGAALITMLLISTMLLAAGGALIVTSSMSVANVIDSTAEVQAYYAAEAGLQASLNALRRDVGATPQATFRTAADSVNMNAWIGYNGNVGGTQVRTLGNVAYNVQVASDGTPAPLLPNSITIRSIGFGPRGARKELEMVLSRNAFAFDAPATITLPGADDCAPMNFSTGNSAAKTYTGIDPVSGISLPAFGVTCGGDQAIANNASNNNTVTNPKSGLLTDANLPSWLQSADNARAFLDYMQDLAYDPNNPNADDYYTSFSGNANGFTFVDGNCTLDGGSGLLIVTGNLEMNGNPDFNGLILVMGEGSINRDGGGNGTIAGAVVVASFDRTCTHNPQHTLAEMEANHPFTAPVFNTNGGGVSTMRYSKGAVDNALESTGFRVSGVRER